ncbi:tetratricopeptide repeat protein [Marivirga tractuosa]|uniref:tetratricopeptide repeat-containing sensor histidine kinase n=1 Tax=Marivirga tractuosa TaxID=1006 RepID=UPI0035D06EBC
MKIVSIIICFLWVVPSVAQLPDADAAARGMLHKGIALIDRDQNYEQAEAVLDSALALSPTKETTIQIQFAKATMYSFTGAYDLAIQYLEDNIPLINNSDKKQRTRFHTNNYKALGDAYMAKGEGTKAMDSYKMALNYAQNHTKQSQAFILHQIGVLLMGQSSYQEAEKYLNMATDEYLSPDLQIGKYINLGEIYLDSDREIEQTADYFLRAKEVALNQDNLRALCYIYNGLGEVKVKEGRNQEAIVLFDKSYQLADSLDLTPNTLTPLLNMAKSYLKIGELAKAFEQLGKAEKVVLIVPSKTKRLEFYDTYAQVHEETGNYEQAIVFMRKANQLKDILFNKEKAKQIEELKIAYETEKKQQQIALLNLQKKKKELESSQQKKAFDNLLLKKELETSKQTNTILSLEKKRQESESKILLLKRAQDLAAAKIERTELLKNAYIIGFLVLLIPIIILLYFYYQKLKAQKALTRQQERNAQQQLNEVLKEQQLQVIRASVDGQSKERKRIALELHDFVGGNLAGIKLQMQQLEIETALTSEIIGNLDMTYNQVRNISHDLLSDKISKSTFIEVLSQYISEFESATTLSIYFRYFNEARLEAMDSGIQTTLFKIIQELLTNTQKHADAKRVDIQLAAHEDSINLLFEDDGTGFDQRSKMNGIGLKSIKHRLSQLQADLRIESLPGHGTIVNIDIPLIYS